MNNKTHYVCVCFIVGRLQNALLQLYKLLSHLTPAHCCVKPTACVRPLFAL